MRGRAGRSVGRRSAMFAAAALFLLAWVGLASVAVGQEMPSADGLNSDAGAVARGVANQAGTARNEAQQDTTSESSSTSESSRTSSEDTGPAMGVATVLSTNQIIAILHAKPEVVVDLKRVMAEYFTQRGIAVQEDSITDEMLFSNIANIAELRRTVSVWLRARGYASDADFAASPELPQDSGTMQEQFSGRDRETEPAGTEADATAALRDLPPDSELLPQYEANATQDAQAERSTSAANREARLDSAIRPLKERVPATAAKEARPSADAIDVVHEPAPYNLQALRDLYTQVPEQTQKAKRFGSDVFLTRGLGAEGGTTRAVGTGNPREMPIDLPIGPDYVLGPGDGLTISVWGGVSQTFARTVDGEGRIVLPEAGAMVVAGLTLERAQALIAGVLGPQFKDAHVVVSVARLRTVRVYVVGDVQRPGAYDISSLSTPLNALYAAGGPTSAGSLRTVRHLRGDRLIREVDLYDFLLHGIRGDVERLEAGDTILVPAAGPQAEVDGMVKRPAIYEFKGQVTLADVLDEAGGVSVSAALAHIRVERIEVDGHRATLEVGVPEGSTLESAQTRMKSFAVKDGDRVVVAPILPYSEKAIYMTGHVVRPGKLPYRDGMKLSDAIRSYQDLLPEPADHGEIVRLMPPDLRPEAIDFSVSDVLAGNGPIHLQPFDTIRILGRYEADAPRVTVRGEVLRPGGYALVDGMTAAQLVRIAGGFKRSALLEDADLASYEIRNGNQVVRRRRDIAIGRAVKDGDAGADALLKPGDVLTIHQISGWGDIGASVTLAGEVTYPGTYGLQDGERLSSVIQRAGGLRATAYPDGAVLVRRQVKELEEKSRSELIRQIETTSVGARLGQTVSGGDDAATLQLLVQQQNQVLQRLRSQPAVGRLVIRIGGDVASWANTPADIELRSGDVLTVPKRPGFVLVSGQVYNASAITYVPNKDAGWYLRQAGGATELASRKEIFVVRANGLVVGRRSGLWFEDDVLETRLYPGDVIVVPQKIVGGSVFWKNMLASAQVLSSIAFTAALTLR